MSINPWWYALFFILVFVASIWSFIVGIIQLRKKNYKRAMIYVLLALTFILGDLIFYLYCYSTYGVYLGR